jgi:hypothetical protein
VDHHAPQYPGMSGGSAVISCKTWPGATAGLLGESGEEAPEGLWVNCMLEKDKDQPSRSVSVVK